MKHIKTIEEAELYREFYSYLLNHNFPEPYETLPITGISIHKNLYSQGYSLWLSHDSFAENGEPEMTGFKCPMIDVDSYLKIKANR